MSLYDYLKNIFFFLLILQLAPPLIESVRKQYMGYLMPQARVGVVSIKGLIYDSSAYNKQLHTFFKDPQVKAILLKIECPGTATGTADFIFNEITQLKKEHHKPIIALVENVCASGGYLIACASDHIITSGSALIGSVGSNLPYMFNVSRLLEHHNIDYVPLYSGKYKSSTNPFSPMTPEDKAMLQGILDDSYDQFATTVALARKISLNNKDQWAEGKLFTGKQALALGLIDEVGAAYNAIKIIKEKALIEGEIVWVHPPQPTGFARIFGGGQSEGSDDSLFSSIANTFCDVIEHRLFSHKTI